MRKYDDDHSPLQPGPGLPPKPQTLPSVPGDPPVPLATSTSQNGVSWGIFQHRYICKSATVGVQHLFHYILLMEISHLSIAIILLSRKTLPPGINTVILIQS